MIKEYRSRLTEIQLCKEQLRQAYDILTKEERKYLHKIEEEKNAKYDEARWAWSIYRSAG